MVELTKSLLAFSWASTLFCVERLGDVLRRDGTKKARSAYYMIESSLRETFSSNPILFALDQIGDQAQAAAFDLFGDFLALKPLDPKWLGSRSRSAIERCLNTAIALQPGENLRLEWRELRNTFAVINLVNRATSMLSLPAGEIRLSGAVDRAYSLGGDYAGLWLIEGLGEEYAIRNFPEGRPPKALLSNGQASDLPRKSLLMLHAGMGIAFARRTVRQLTPYSLKNDISTALLRFVELVGDNARPGYEGPALESLGLVTRTWYPEMVPVIDQSLWSINSAALEYFWHGVGRAEYFNPLSSVPGASPFQRLAQQAPHQLGLLNGISGTAWAYTLVNIKAPDLTLNLLKTEGEHLLPHAFTNGLVSAILMATEMLPDAAFATQFTQLRPAVDRASLEQSWDRMIRVPIQTGLSRWFPVLQRSQTLGEVFRYQDLAKLVASLEEKR